jgi:uncharacterized membrane protein
MQPTRSRAAALLLLLAWCVVLIGVRVVWSGRLSYVFLVWNLILATIPVVAAFALRRVVTGNALSVRAMFLALVWLLFLPNAPYLATDLMHLRSRPFVPLWYDVALLVSCAFTGVILGYVSIAEIQRLLRTRVGDRSAWVLTTIVMFLCAFGMYLGRFERWNSWHIVTRPWPLILDAADRVLHPLSHLRTTYVTAVYGVTLFVGYVVFRLLFVSDAEVGEKRQHGTP